MKIYISFNIFNNLSAAAPAFMAFFFDVIYEITIPAGMSPIGGLPKGSAPSGLEKK